MNIDQLIREAASWLWGPPMLIFLSAVGIYFTLRLRGLQFTQLTTAARATYRYRSGAGKGNISPLQSLFAALGGLIGNGNLAGVATAIAVGGPGAIFWFWISSFIAMIIVYAETRLATMERVEGSDGTYSGGPMHYIEKLLGIRWLALLFALAMGFKSLLATATIQSNSIALASNSALGIRMIYTCLVLAALTWLVTIGGLRTIARTLEKITPVMVLAYFVTASLIILSHLDALISVLELIVQSAFTPAGATGGFAGATVMMALRYGVARGFYSNEAGTGSSPIMYSTARFDSSHKIALIGMFGVVIDTLVGSLTAFVLLLTGVWASGETSTALTTSAFADTFGDAGGLFLFITSFLFGYSTLIAWSFYGEQCFAYIWGPGIRKFYRWAFCLAICFGFFEAELLWSWGDLLNALTVLINVVAVVLLIGYCLPKRRGELRE
ncbi:MAG: sodium:alanine symporter family protein [Acidobacteriota bacterium]|nr:MAG: sodium:alanine symporter family protein [Acidobacteriota bacterium]